jgi:hypothetical protein
MYVVAQKRMQTFMFLFILVIACSPQFANCGRACRRMLTVPSLVCAAAAPREEKGQAKLRLRYGQHQRHSVMALSLSILMSLVISNRATYSIALADMFGKHVRVASLSTHPCFALVSSAQFITVTASSCEWFCSMTFSRCRPIRVRTTIAT